MRATGRTMPSAVQPRSAGRSPAPSEMLSRAIASKAAAMPIVDQKIPRSSQEGWRWAYWPRACKKSMEHAASSPENANPLARAPAPYQTASENVLLMNPRSPPARPIGHDRGFRTSLSLDLIPQDPRLQPNCLDPIRHL